MAAHASAAVAFQAITSTQALTKRLDTSRLFEQSHVEAKLSPIDRLIENTNSINKIYLNYLPPSADPLPQELGALVVLGYMSAVESYLRAMVRGLINIDEYSHRLVEPRPVTFGAALHHSNNLLPEALLEDTSLAADKNVVNTLKELAGVKGQVPAHVQLVLSEYNKICQIRHCCVHRFGKLGTKNAIELGLDSHKLILEKPLKTSVQDLQDMAEVLRTFSKTINNYVFENVLERSARNRDEQGRRLYQIDWTWQMRKDRPRFKRYYELFCTTLDAVSSPPMDEIYKSFRDECRPMRPPKASKKQKKK